MLGARTDQHFVPVCDNIYRFTSLVMDESFQAWNTASMSASRSRDGKDGQVLCPADAGLGKKDMSGDLGKE